MDDLEKSSIAQFNTWAKDYDRKRFWPFYFSNKAVLLALNPQDGASVLDIGCGTGILLQLLAQSGNDLKLYGLDVASGMAETAQAKLGKTAEICQGSASHLPYDDCSFEYVTCSTSFHHYSEPQKALCEMFRVLKPGGSLILLDPFTNGILRKVICAVLDTLSRETGTNLFTREQMFRMFQNAGFCLIEHNTYLYYKLMTTGVKSSEICDNAASQNQELTL
jgi:ubiquinone/menaquinone biosynthesis C-methylase UbiE